VPVPAGIWNVCPNEAAVKRYTASKDVKHLTIRK